MLAVKRYANTRNETASKERLMVLLFETALKHIRLGAAALETGRAIEAAEPLSKAGEIVAELTATLDHARAPQLCAQLTDLYLFVADRLVVGAGTRNAKPIREAERVFAPIADAFATAVGIVQGGQHAPAAK
ncbi:MAG TPA: flagellar export chaperone FliS [Polyangia bacterium]|nr:flagellar export chaperone FliS [Polyangia bacterium]